MKQKVVIIGPAYPLRGGLATYNERLARAFKEAGDEAEIVTFSLQYPDFLFPGQTQFSTDPAPEDLEIKALINSVNPLSWLKTGLYLKKQKPDIVIFRYWLPFMGPAWEPLPASFPATSTRDSAITDNVIPHEKRPGDWVFTKYFLSACHGFITMSRSVLEDLKKFVPEKPAVYHPHPLYDNFGESQPKTVAKTALKLDPETNYLLFFGFIRAYKGLDLLLEAFADERLAKLKNVKLIIAGEYYEDAEPYEKLIQKYDLENRIVRATDFIPNSQVATYFSAADLIVQPYKHATQSGVSQIAYHFDKPMLVTDVGGLAELIPDGKVGYVTQPIPKLLPMPFMISTPPAKKTILLSR